MPDTIDWTEKKVHWIELVTVLVDDISTWCEELGWPCDRSGKVVSEDQVGDYEAPCLTIHMPSGRLHIDPIGLTVIGAEGRIDILAYPSLNRLLLLRMDESWKLYTDSRLQWPQAWGKETFSAIAESLSA